MALSDSSFRCLESYFISSLLLGQMMFVFGGKKVYGSYYLLPIATKGCATHVSQGLEPLSLKGPRYTFSIVPPWSRFLLYESGDNSLGSRLSSVRVSVSSSSSVPIFLHI